MIRHVYTAVLVLGLIVTAPLYLYRGLRHRKYLGSLKQRFGRLDIEPSDHFTVWVHAVSVGEVLASEPFVRGLAAAHPDWRIVISTTTSTGQTTARERFPGHDVVYFPLDLPWPVRRAIDSVRPRLACFVETELWPNFIAECRRRGTVLAVVNGRISDRSFRGYSRLRGALRSVLGHIDRFAMQSDVDADRIVALGAPSDRVTVTGNMKYDVDRDAFDRRSNTIRVELERAFGLPESRPIVVAGSTADGEEAMLLEALVKLRREPGLESTRLMIAPRRPERFDEVERLIRSNDLACARRSRPEQVESADVLLLDTIGELAAAYALGEMVFVGGSLVPHGGHNILEPALSGRPVVTGPYTHNFREITADFVAAGAAVQIGEGDREEMVSALAGQVASLLKNRAARERMAARAAEILSANAGAAARTLLVVDGLVPSRTVGAR